MKDPARICLVLHAHLPLVRHPEHENFLEEDWLFEAITECYVPLFSSLLRLHDEGIPFGLGLSVSAPLVAMLDDALLRRRYRRHLGTISDLAAKEAANHGPGSDLGPAARHNLDRLVQVSGFLDQQQGDLLTPLRRLQNQGAVEILSCSGTHALLPVTSDPRARRAQIRAGYGAHVRAFGRRPRGMWLPECGYDHGLDRILVEEGIGYSFVDALALERAQPAPRAGLYAPVKTSAGLALLARDRETAVQIWSAEHGYPGDGAYREFHRDLGYDAGYSYIKPYLHPDGVRRAVGLKYHRITDRKLPLSEKQIYDPEAAGARAREHARAFVDDRKKQASSLRRALDVTPTITATFDAELFGHWWYEGPIFLEEVLRQVARSRELQLVRPGDAITASGPLERIEPSPSTWGADGNNQVWVSPDNAWLYRYQHWAESRMPAIVRSTAGRGGLRDRAARQAHRELLLMQSSDWAFMLATGTNPAYGARRFKEHFLAFKMLHDGLASDSLSESEVSAREARTPLFDHPDLSTWLAGG